MPRDELPWNTPEIPFSYCLQFRMQPYYVLSDALYQLRRNMTLELWKTSVFCPKPLTTENRPEWNRHAERFALGHRARTAQWEKKLEFVRFVEQRHDEGESAERIAGGAVNEGLWPFGTIHPKQREEAYDAVVPCERAVYRVIKRIAQGRRQGQTPQATEEE